MSSNSGVIVNRANETSPFYQALKSRNSKSLPELYSAEVNSESAAQSVVEVESSTAPSLSRTVRIEMPRYGLLNRLYLHTVFSAAGGTVSASAFVKQVPFIGAMCIREARLMYNGSVLQKTDGFSIVSDLWKHSSNLEKKKLQELIGAYDCLSGSTMVNTADEFNENQEQRSKSFAQDFYCPLDFYFSAKHSPNRALDLSVLANPVILEVDLESSANIFKVVGSGATAPTLSNISAMCYLTELDPEVEKSYRALSYSPASPLTQLAFNTERVIVSSGNAITTGDLTIDVKLSQFVGSVYKLVVFATAQDSFAGNEYRLRPATIKEIQLKATGTNLINQDNLQKKEAILESYHSGGDYHAKSEDIGATTDAQFTDINIDTSGSTGPLEDGTQSLIATAAVNAVKGSEWDYNIKCNASNFYELVFKKPYDMSKVSASGSVAMGQLSIPSLRCKVAGSSSGQFGAKSEVLGGASGTVGSAENNQTFDIHVVAYTTSLISYNTNSQGSTNIRQIMN